MPDSRAIAEQACAEAGGTVDVGRVHAFVDGLARAGRRGRRLSRTELSDCRTAGRGAAAHGVTLPALVDAYLSAARLWWAASSAPSQAPADLSDLGVRAFRIVDDALAEVARGHVEGQRQAFREAESMQRALVDELLDGPKDVSRLLSLAERTGFAVSASYVVAVVGALDPTREAAGQDSALEGALRHRLPDRSVFVETRDRRHVCIVEMTRPAGRAAFDEAAPLLVESGRRLADGDDWLVTVGHASVGPRGIARSFREALDGWTAAASLGWRGRIVHADEITVFRVLTRDHESLADLVESVLGPLRMARGGAAALLETAQVFLATGGVTTETARRLHLSARAVTYRLDRIRTLTGYNLTDPADRLTLHVSVAGAQLIGWPDSSPSRS